MNMYRKRNHCCLIPETKIYITTVYIPSSANKDTAAHLITEDINNLADSKPEALQIIVGDMNRCEPQNEEYIVNGHFCVNPAAILFC